MEQPRETAPANTQHRSDPPPRDSTAGTHPPPRDSAPEIPPQRADRLLCASFMGLTVTQLLTAVNDNIFRWLAIGIGKQYVPPESIGTVLMAGSACFVLPYLFLAAPAGYLADRFSKRTVIVACKVAEIVIVALGVMAILVGQVWLLFVVVALAGAQSALLSPSKLGSIPEILAESKIPAANGIVGLTTVMATVVGTVVGNLLVEATGAHGKERWWLSALVLVGIAVVGWVCSLWIRPLRAANPEQRFPWDFPRQTIRDLRILATHRPMFRVSLGIMFFWSLGMLAQLNIDQFAAEGGATSETTKSPLLVSLVVGVGVGSVLAGIWSGGRVELGILPLGACGIAVSSLLMFTVQGTIVSPSAAYSLGFGFACLFLFGLGLSAGLFDIPLSSYMQDRSPAHQRGAILAASNFLTFSGMLVMSILFAGLRYPLRGEPLFSARQIFLLASLLTVPVFAYIVWLIPQASVRFVVWLASRTIYRVRVSGVENLPAEGGALLVSNHVSWIDGIMLMLACPRPIRMVAFAGNFQQRWIQWLADRFGAILISSRPKEILRALATAKEAVQRGELVCIFAEGAITRTGQLQAFKPGMTRIVGGTGAPVIPVYLDELWGSIFSFEGGKFFWKRPRKWPYPISISYGHPLEDSATVSQIRQAVMVTGAEAAKQRTDRSMQLTREFIRRCKQRLRIPKVADSMGTELSGGDLLARSLVLRRLLRRHALTPEERNVGVLLPPSVPGVAVNMALALDRRVSVNLNYTVSPAVMNACIEQAGIRHVLTSRRFLDLLKTKRSTDYETGLNAKILCLEDFQSKPTLADKLVAGLWTYVLPASCIDRILGLHRVRADDLLTIIFTSGSTGNPKGVMLSYGNVASNVAAINQLVHLTSQDVVLGILPLFHSFGYTVTMWTVMALDVKGAYHTDPTEARQVGKLCKNHGGTVLLATPTFLRSYLRRVEPDQFKTLDVVVAGAEKLPSDLCDAFQERFGVRPVEGYGATELSPLVSVNVPPSRSHGSGEDCREGTVGRPIPGVAARIVDPDSGAELPADQAGMLQIKGPNLMQGYLGRPDLTTEVVKDGWYVTGDVAVIDEEGFIKITDRLSRFSKIGGEMVPHIKIEETLSRILTGEGEPELKAVVTSVPDPRKGERLIVIHTQLEKTPEQLRQALLDSGLPPIFVPAQDSFHQVSELPVLGSGKLDLKGIKQIALEAFPPEP